MHSLLIALATAPAPTPTPSLRPGLSEDQVTPGLLGFLLTAFIVVLTALLIVDMVRRIRRVRYRAQVEAEREAAGDAGFPADGTAFRADGAGSPPTARLTGRKSTAMRDPETADRGFPNPPSGASNALAAEPSAYLRQHAGNPVHWQPFGDAAFAAAAARDVPVFLSIGYAACHWCHVMAHESFEDRDTADYLNAHFVSVKVDREERPDVDAVYMTATQAISGEGGWPMSVFLLPDGRAFHAGTYYPPRPMPGRPSFRQVLEAVNEAWTERRGAVEANADTLARGIAASQPAAALHLDGPPEPLDAALLAEAVTALSGAEDRAHGGFGGAPKFPPSAVLEFLIRHAAAPSDSMPPAAGAGHRGPGLRGPGPGARTPRAWRPRRRPGTWPGGAWRQCPARRCSTSSTAASPAIR